MIDARTLQYFQRIVELGAINRAAQSLNVSQPTLTRAIQLLEADVGEQLLVRTPHGVQVTNAGDLLIERSRPILSQLEQLRVEISGSADVRVSVGLPLSMQRLMTLPFATRAVARHPGLKLRLYEGINNAIRRWMEEGVVDFAIIVALEQVPAHFEATPFICEPLHLVGRDLARFGAAEVVALGELGELDMILPGRPNAIRALVERSMARAGVDYRCTIEAETIASCLALSAAGLGYTIVPSCALAGLAEGAGGDSAQLSSIPVAGVTLAWDLCVNRSRRHSRLLTSVIELFRDLADDQVAAGAWREGRVVQPSLPSARPRLVIGPATPST